MTIQTAAEIYRKFDIPGVQSSGMHKPEKPAIIARGTMIEALHAAGPNLAYAIKALLLADLAHAANTLALVWNDGTPANNGMYQKLGASASGSWTRIGDLPTGVVRITVTGGTANAIVATATETPLLPGNKLYLLTPTANNTGPTNISVNAAPAVSIKNALGSSLAANSLLDDLPVLMAWVVDHYQILVSVPVDATGVLNDAIDARDAAEAAEGGAAGYASALGNQVYNFDSYTLAQAATVPVGVKGLRVFGWAAYGDGPTAEYFRVALQPSTPAGKLRTTDRFLPNGSTDATNGGWWQLVVSGAQDVRKFGIFGDGSTVVTTLVQNALNTASIFFPPASGNYVLTGDILLVSNRRIQVQRGATIINTGGRFTGHLPGGGNIDFEINGTIGFLATADAPQMTDWPTSAEFGDERGLIEIGGSAASPASNIRVYGGGRVYSDYVWAGVPSALTNKHFQINRKGISIWNSSHALVEGMEVDHVHGEAVYFNGYANNQDIKFLSSFVHNVAFNGFNFNTSLAYQGLLIAHNTVVNALCGIEISGGVADNNSIDICNNGIITGGGGGITLRVTNNKVTNAVVGSYVIEFSSAAVQNVVVQGNESISAGATAFYFEYLSTFQVTGNKSYAHASRAAGKSFIIGANCGSGYVDGNVTSVVGAFSNGNVVNLAGGDVVLGTNPVF
jgi:hypothetical protein